MMKSRLGQFKYIKTKYATLSFIAYKMFFSYWLQKGFKAPQAAGRIHTDFEKGFIMAEVMKFEDFKNEGTEAACKVIYNILI